jgi:hypothetical protein
MNWLRHLQLIGGRRRRQWRGVRLGRCWRLELRNRLLTAKSLLLGGSIVFSCAKILTWHHNVGVNGERIG